MKQLISRDNNAADIYSEDDKFNPGRIFIGDISSDGYPDLLITVKYINGTSRSHILINEPCQSTGDTACPIKAFRAHRRHFNVHRN